MAIINLKPGMAVVSRRLLTNIHVQNMGFPNECANIGGGITAGATFIVAEVSKVPDNMWVKLAIPGSDPVRYIKIKGEPYAHNFQIK